MNGFIIKDSATYDKLRYFTQVVLPAIGTLYFALASIWGLPEPEAVVGTIVAVDTFLGVLLKISTDNYNENRVLEGRANLVNSPDGNEMGVAMDLGASSAEGLDGVKEIRLKVDDRRG